MKRSHLLIVIALALGTTSACVVRAGFGAHVNAPPPDLVMIDGGVYVVEGYDRPIFWDANYYWWFDNGIWYRSSYYDTGFVRVSAHVVPGRIRGIHNPHRYVRYRARGTATRRRAVRAHRRNERVKSRRSNAPVRRDHRRPAPKKKEKRSPVRVRDHRRR